MIELQLPKNPACINPRPTTGDAVKVVGYAPWVDMLFGNFSGRVGTITEDLYEDEECEVGSPYWRFVRAYRCLQRMRGVAVRVDMI